MKNNKTINFLLLSFIVTVFLGACGKKEKESTPTPQNEKIDLLQSDKNYKEKKLNLPQGLVEMNDMRVDNNEIYIAGRTKSEVAVWKTSNTGEKWEKILDFTSKLPKIKTNDGITITLSDKNDGTIRFFSEEKNSYYFFDGSGKLEKATDAIVDLVSEKGIATLAFVGEKSLLGLGGLGKGGAFLINSQTGEGKEILGKNETVESFEVSGSELYLLTRNGMKGFNLSKGKEQKPNKVMEKTSLLVQQQSTPTSYFNFSTEEGNVFLSTEKYILKVDNKNAEILIKKAKNQLGNSDNTLLEIVPFKKNQILANVWNGKTPELFLYTPSGKQEQAKNKLSVYALSENDLMQNARVKEAVTSYQRKHPETDIEIEIGTEDGEISVDEAIKNLNTRLSSGEAPDILILDGLNAEKYIEKGALADLSALRKGYRDEDYFTSIFSSFEKENKVYALPMAFAAVDLYGPKSLTDATSTLTDFSNAVEKLAKEKKTPVFENWLYSEMFANLYRSYVAGKQNKLEEKDIKEFYEAMKKLYDTVDMKKVQKEKKLSDISPNLLYGGGAVNLVTTSEVQFSLENIVTPEDIGDLEIAQKEEKKPISLFKDEAERIFIPIYSLAIAAQSKNQEEAKAFIDFSLSEDMQKKRNFYAFAVNKEAFREALKERFEEQKEDGLVVEVRTESGGNKKIQLDKNDLGDATINSWITRFDELNTPVKVEQGIFNLIAKEADNVMTGKSTATDVSEKVYRKIKLYLSE